MIVNESSSTLPRPEYPRPQLVRPEWANLNGKWEFAFDDADEGQRQGWHDGRPLAGQITVPFPYQSQLSGINDKGIHEVVWYARTFSPPATWQGRDLLLHFGAVDYQTTVWVNGREVGHNRGGHIPFSFDIAPYLQAGDNRLTLRVEDRQDPHQPRGKQSSSGLPQGIDYYCTTGIWQTVWLEPVSAIRIDELRITPLVEEGAFELFVYLHAPATGWRLEVEVLDAGVVVAGFTGKAELATARLFLKVPDAKLWSPQSPHLYDLRVRMYEGDQLLDEVASYAGLRSVKLRGGRVLLNDEPVYLAMVLDQGYWPESYLAAPSDAALRADVEWIKRLGFNVRANTRRSKTRAGFTGATSWGCWCGRRWPTRGPGRLRPKRTCWPNGCAPCCAITTIPASSPGCRSTRAWVFRACRKATRASTPFSNAWWV
jgi:hypothetical protein